MIEFIAERPIWTGHLELYAKVEMNGKLSAVVADGVKVVDVSPGGMWPKFVSLDLMHDSGQSLFDALWRVGYRPNNGESSMAQVEALKYHLEDMRKLVFKP